MLPFKAQGANSALIDALNLANCIFKSSIVSNETEFALLDNYERMMIQRSRTKVLKSRLAGINLHTKSVLQKGNITRAMAAESID
jgi:2-polyprenyl-6-methoxyphenol hydroxylase-like FAD-dependent oxidoreductase